MIGINRRSLGKSNLWGASLACILAAGSYAPAYAQVAKPDAADAETSTEEPTAPEITVTGTRLPQGFSAPTPIAVTSAEDLKLSAPNNIADGLANLPQFAGNNKTNVGVPSVAIGTTGQNLLNLRGLGFNRNLVLLDGHRIVATNQVGSVDVNMLPQAVIKRVDTVTGGASAAYGSDAISGVVNFVIDRKFTGLKAEVQGGISSRGDVPNFLGSLSWGGSFADDRLHVVLSGEYSSMNGIDVNEPSGRDWFEKAAGRIANPTAGATPSFILVDDIRSSLGYPGGFVTFAAANGALRGITFEPGGALGTFNRGTTTGSAFQNGGSGARVNVSLVPNQQRYNVFGSLKYDISDSISLTVDGLYARSHTLQRAFVEPETGSASQFTIFRDNAFMPTALRNLMVTNNLNQILVGRYEADFPPVELEYTTKLYRGSAGLEGKLGARWNWDLNYAYSQTDQRAQEGNNVISRNLYAAVDAVSSGGQIVCRSGIAGCVPLNIFGLGSPSAAAIDYVLGDSYKDLRLTQHNVALNLRGEIGDGFLARSAPISVATGVEYRDDEANQTSDSISQTVNSFTGILGAPSAQNGRQGAFRFFNPQPFSGGIKVVEGYLEVGVPLAQDKPFFQKLDINGAIRQAHYTANGQVYTFAAGVSSSASASSSINATTWKIGGNWAPVEDIRFRITRSRDIRAPSIIDLYNGSQFSSSTVTFNSTTVPLFQLTRGNPVLTPEKADTLTFGVVLKPRFMSGFQASVDYYNINVNNAIGGLLAQQQVNLCAAGDQTYCALQSFANGALTVVTPPFNLNTQKAKGWDIEAQYRTNLGAGKLSLRGYVNINSADYIQPAVGSLLTMRGLPTNPKWRATLQANYQTDHFGLFIQERVIAASLIDPNLVEGVGISENDVPRVAYTDVTLTAKVMERFEAFFTVSNLFDRDPPVSPQPTTTFSIPYSGAYDTIGRAFTVGVRVKM
jgi:iron complex outermembrane recepter protein